MHSLLLHFILGTCIIRFWWVDDIKNQSVSVKGLMVPIVGDKPDGIQFGMLNIAVCHTSIKGEIVASSRLAFGGSINSNGHLIAFLIKPQGEGEILIKIPRYVKVPAFGGKLELAFNGD